MIRAHKSSFPNGKEVQFDIEKSVLRTLCANAQRSKALKRGPSPEVRRASIYHKRNVTRRETFCAPTCLEDAPLR